MTEIPQGEERVDQMMISESPDRKENEQGRKGRGLIIESPERKENEQGMSWADMVSDGEGEEKEERKEEMQEMDARADNYMI
jgi:hypothetical protein